MEPGQQGGWSTSIKCAFVIGKMILMLQFSIFMALVCVCAVRPLPLRRRAPNLVPFDEQLLLPSLSPPPLASPLPAAITRQAHRLSARFHPESRKLCRGSPRAYAATALRVVESRRRKSRLLDAGSNHKVAVKHRDNSPNVKPSDKASDTIPASALQIDATAVSTRCTGVKMPKLKGMDVRASALFIAAYVSALSHDQISRRYSDSLQDDVSRWRQRGAPVDIVGTETKWVQERNGVVGVSDGAICIFADLMEENTRSPSPGASPKLPSFRLIQTMGPEDQVQLSRIATTSMKIEPFENKLDLIQRVHESQEILVFARWSKGGSYTVLGRAVPDNGFPHKVGHNGGEGCRELTLRLPDISGKSLEELQSSVSLEDREISKALSLSGLTDTALFPHILGSVRGIAQRSWVESLSQQFRGSESERPLIVIDCTCGNGYDSEFIANLATNILSKDSPPQPLAREEKDFKSFHQLTSRLFRRPAAAAYLPPHVQLISIDVDPTAVRATRTRLLPFRMAAALREEDKEEGGRSGIKFSASVLQQSHESFPEEIEKETVGLMIWNLGFLPGQLKPSPSQTNARTTVRSLANAIPLIREGGLLSITLYPGHPGGDVEAQEVERALETPDFWESAGSNQNRWRVMRHRNIVNQNAPYLILATRLW